MILALDFTHTQLPGLLRSLNTVSPDSPVLSTDTQERVHSERGGVLVFMLYEILY